MPASDDIRALRALLRGRGDLVASRVALANQLRSLLESFWPGAAGVFTAVDRQIALAFIGRYPPPDSAGRLGEKRMAAFMASHAYCGRRSAKEILARLRAAPAGLAGDAEAEAKGELVRALVAVLERIVAEIATLSARIEHLVAELPDGRIVMLFPRAGRLFAAQILAGLGDVRERFPTEDQLAARPASARSPTLPARAAPSSSAGPATRTSGRPSPASPTIPGTPALGPRPSIKAPGGGCKHAHAVRILARAWVRVLWRAWQDRKTYDPGQHRAAARIA